MLLLADQLQRWLLLGLKQTWRSKGSHSRRRTAWVARERAVLAGSHRRWVACCERSRLEPTCMHLVEHGGWRCSFRQHEALRLELVLLLLTIGEVGLVLGEGRLSFELLHESLGMPLRLQRVAVRVIFVELAHARHDQLLQQAALKFNLGSLLRGAPVDRGADSDPGWRRDVRRDHGLVAQRNLGQLACAVLRLGSPRGGQVGLNVHEVLPLLVWLISADCAAGIGPDRPESVDKLRGEHPVLQSSLVLHVCLVQGHRLSDALRRSFDGARTCCVGLQPLHSGATSLVGPLRRLLEVILDSLRQAARLISLAHPGLVNLLLLDLHPLLVSLGLLVVDGVLEGLGPFVVVVGRQVDRLRVQVAQWVLRRDRRLPASFRPLPWRSLRLERGR